MAEGILRTAQEKWEIAERAFQSAKETEQIHGFPYGQAGILVGWAEVYRKRSGAEDRHRAERLLKEALSIYERCGARTDIARTQQALAL